MHKNYCETLLLGFYKYTYMFIIMFTTEKKTGSHIDYLSLLKNLLTYVYMFYFFIFYDAMQGPI